MTSDKDTARRQRKTKELTLGWDRGAGTGSIEAAASMEAAAACILLREERTIMALAYVEQYWHTILNFFVKLNNTD